MAGLQFPKSTEPIVFKILILSSLLKQEAMQLLSKLIVTRLLRRLKKPSRNNDISQKKRS
jgi:hypothetical protein